MGIRVNTNIMALNAQRNLRSNQATLQSSTEKIASGMRINKSADDAAGLAISENLGAAVRSFQQSGRNAQDGISFIQVAEGGMNEVSNMIVRLRELSVQSASDTIGNTERGFLNNEVQQVKQEMQRIAMATEYNGTKLLDGSGQKLDFQIGIKNDEFKDRISYDVSGTNTTIDSLGLAGIDVSSKEGAQGGLENLDGAINKLNGNRAVLGALQNRLTSTIANNEVAIENYSAAKSRIRDADFATVTADLARDTVRTQASTSILAQANQQSGLALKLLA